jgi:hypothetical protein
MRKITAAVVAGLAVISLLPSTAGAQTTGQGSSLESAANYPYHCDYRWVPGYGGSPGGFGPGGQQEWVPQHIGASTCSLWQIGARGQVQTTHLVPATGTVTRARIKSGANPAPVSIATVRQFTGRAQQGNLVTTCCYGISQTEVVNPTPNAITEIPVNFRVEVRAYDPNDPKTAGWHDIVAVNVHGDTGTLPMSDLGGPKPMIAPDSDPGAVWYFPKFNPSESNQNQWSASGFEVLMNYDWCPETSRRSAAGARQAAGCPSSTPTPTPDPENPVPTGPADPKTLAQISSPKLVLKGKSVPVAVKCTQAVACEVTVRLRTRAKKPVLLGKRKTSIQPGMSARVKVPLSARNRRRVGAKGLKVRAEVVLGSAGTISRNLMLKRATS